LKAAKKLAIKTAKDDAKAMYKLLRADKVSVVDANATVDKSLAENLRRIAALFGGVPDEEEEDEAIAA
jgi:hypothetical protein